MMHTCCNIVVHRNIVQEMSGVAAGICDSQPNKASCNVTYWEETIQTVNMLPEVSNVIGFS